MSTEIKNLSKLDSSGLKEYYQQAFVSEGLLVLSEDEGVSVELEYNKGKLKKEQTHLASIEGIPKKITKKESIRLQVIVSMSKNDFDVFNESQRIQRQPQLTSIHEMVEAYLQRSKPEELKERKLKARLKTVYEPSSCVWHDYSMFIVDGFLLPEHFELLYGDAAFKATTVDSVIHSFTRKRRFGKTAITSLTLKPYSRQGYFVQIKI